MSNQKSNWADDSDSDDEIGDNNNVKLRKEVEEIDEASESEEDECDDDESDVGFANQRSNTSVEVEMKKEPKKVDICQLSKAERKALKQKELNDLDSMLAEFGVEKSVDEDRKVDVVVDENTVANTQNEAEKDAKKKKKKSGTKKKEEKPTEGVESDGTTSNEDKVVPVLVTDVASLLKNKISRAKKPSTENQAISEALKESQAKKKKSKDKTKYNEYSY